MIQAVRHLSEARGTRRAYLWCMLLRPWVAAMAVGVACASSARAESARAISRATAWSEGAAHGPSVAVASAAAKAADDMPGVAPLSLPPRLQLMAGPRFGSLGTGVDWSVTAMIDLPLRPLAASRGKVSEGLSGFTKSELARTRIDAGFAAAIAWSQALEAKEVLAVRVRGEKDSEAIVGLAQKRLKAGVGLPSELALARGDYGAAGAATLDAEGGVVDSYAELRLAIGAETDEAIDPIGTLCKTDDAPLDDKAVYAEAEERSPLLASARAKSLLAQNDVLLARATAGPVLGFGAQYARDSYGESVFSGIVSVPLPFADPSKFDAARAKIAAAESTADIERVRVVLKKLVSIALHDRLHTREVRKKLLDDALEPLREAVRLAKVQYETGTQDLASVLLTRQRLFTVEEQVVRACGNVHRADLAIFHLLGKAPS